MPTLTSELAGIIAVAALIALVWFFTDPDLAARRRRNRVRRHAASGCRLCLNETRLEDYLDAQEGNR